MGEAVIGLFCQKGARLAAINIDETTLNLLRHDTPELACIRAYLADTKTVGTSIGKTVKHLSGLDALCSHAGMKVPASIEIMGAVTYDAPLALNLTASVRATAVLPCLRQTGRGSIVVTSSVAGLVGSIPLGRLAEPAEIAEAALWLQSDASSLVTGTEQTVDGETTAR